jgi:lactoylglutathione lyase
VTRRTVDYLILYVRDLDQAVGFYTEVVGLPLKLRRPGYAELATENLKFALYQRSGLPGLIGEEAAGAPAAATGPAGETLFLVDDVDAEAERLRHAGVQVLTGPTDRPWGHRTLHLLDPDGNVVELAQEIPRSDRG